MFSYFRRRELRQKYKYKVREKALSREIYELWAGVCACELVTNSNTHEIGEGVKLFKEVVDGNGDEDGDAEDGGEAGDLEGGVTTETAEPRGTNEGFAQVLSRRTNEVMKSLSLRSKKSQCSKRSSLHPNISQPGSPHDSDPPPLPQLPEPEIPPQESARNLGPVRSATVPGRKRGEYQEKEVKMQILRERFIELVDDEGIWVKVKVDKEILTSGGMETPLFHKELRKRSENCRASTTQLIARPRMNYGLFGTNGGRRRIFKLEFEEGKAKGRDVRSWRDVDDVPPKPSHVDSERFRSHCHVVDRYVPSRSPTRQYFDTSRPRGRSPRREDREVESRYGTNNKYTLLSHIKRPLLDNHALLYSAKLDDIFETSLTQSTILKSPSQTLSIPLSTPKTTPLTSPTTLFLSRPSRKLLP
ncbi:hypothetical protein G7Y89_g3022 [Cudoniella acicularis]|uniref:Uncharacterized protein n=1 Tax=Cudoniella acicularis TaxID=354080 RepID=A0A8H4RU50_9HELO|nr:hypothetical protein G7Y89_g3022 [Cudoniella acicularis]